MKMLIKAVISGGWCEGFYELIYDYAGEGSGV